jgi:hypothetical protein
MWELCSRICVDDEDDVAGLKVMKILEQQLQHQASSTSVYSHMYGDHDDSQNPWSSQDCGSRWLWTGIQKLCSMTACSSGDLLLLRSPSRGHAKVREVEGGTRVWPAARRWRVRLGRRGSWELVCSLLPKAPPYIGGGGAPYPSPSHPLGWRPREERAAAARA